MKLFIAKAILFSFILINENFVLEAQMKSSIAIDTLETFFINQQRKDGIEINGHTLYLPEEVIAKCNHQKIRVIGSNTYNKIVSDRKSENDSPEIRQGRYEYIRVMNDSGIWVNERHFVSTGPDFSVDTVWVWNKKIKKWKLLFRK